LSNKRIKTRLNSQLHQIMITRHIADKHLGMQLPTDKDVLRSEPDWPRTSQLLWALPMKWLFARVLWCCEPRTGRSVNDVSQKRIDGGETEHLGRNVHVTRPCRRPENRLLERARR
jgi:hypothetical protein